MNAVPRLRVGLVALHMGSYFAQEHGVFDRAEQGLLQIASESDIEVVIAPSHVETSADASSAREFFETQQLDSLVVLLATCTTSDPILELCQLQIPTMLWAVPEPHFDGPVQLNSYVALQIAASTLHRHNDMAPARRITFKCLFGEATESRFSKPFLTMVRALRTRKALARARVGLIGDVAPGFVNLNFDSAYIRSALGVEVARHDVSELLRDSHDTHEVSAVAQEMCRAAREVNVPMEVVVASARVYLNLRRIVEENGYNALAVRDWPEMQSQARMSPLLAMAWLSEHDGIPVACEGDALGAIALLALQSASNSMSTLLDVGPANPSGDELLVWHLGSSPHGFADEHGVTYEFHSTLGRKSDGPFGTVVDQRFASGPVTLINLSDGGRTLLIAGGRLTEGSLPGPSGDRGWLVDPSLSGTPLSVTDFLDTSLQHGLTHHCALAYGDWQEEMLELGRLLEMDHIAPG